ncbi:MAG TPA: hypothetical protein VFC03_11410 [Acidimicrobiales bacterium]|nr:hypothetical protein [Acidimicrobiales bacterium]
MKSVREHMDIHSAYREVGSYRAATDICGTTPKAEKRSVEAARAAETGPVPGEVRHNYNGVADLVAETVARIKVRISAKRLLPVLPIAFASFRDPPELGVHRVVLRLTNTKWVLKNDSCRHVPPQCCVGRIDDTKRRASMLEDCHACGRQQSTI